MAFKKNIQWVPISKVKPSPLNFKIPMSAEKVAKLKESILLDRSYGVLTVRELPDGTYEVLDGNQRLQILHELGLTEVPIENLGPLTDAQAILAIRRRNYLWADPDYARYLDMMDSIVLPEIPPEEWSRYLPDDIEILQRNLELIDLRRELSFDASDVPRVRPPTASPRMVTPVEDDEEAAAMDPVAAKKKSKSNLFAVTVVMSRDAYQRLIEQTVRFLGPSGGSATPRTMGQFVEHLLERYAHDSQAEGR